MDHNLNVLKSQQLLKLICEVLRSIRKKNGEPMTQMLTLFWVLIDNPFNLAKASSFLSSSRRWHIEWTTSSIIAKY